MPDLLGVVFVLSLILLWLSAPLLLRGRRKAKFRREYGMKLPRRFNVARSRRSHPLGFELSFPHWRYPNKDGSGHRRRTHQQLLRPLSWMNDGSLTITTDDPIRMYRLIVLLRSAGFEVPFNDDEQKYFNRREEVRHLRDVNVQRQRNRDGFFQSFNADHRGFEFWCADLFRSQGWDARTTPGSSDGGFDLILRRGDVRALGECKLYDSVKIGRPALQKLVGAMAGEGITTGFFITTSSFSRPAINYAEGQNLTLIDGEALVEMVRQQPIHQVSGVVPAVDPDLNAVFTIEQLGSLYPPDVKWR